MPLHNIETGFRRKYNTGIQGLPSGFVGGLYHANAVNFDGTNDFLKRGANLTNIADGKVLTFSAWVKRGTDGVNHFLLSSMDAVNGNANIRTQIDITTDDRFQVVGRSGPGVGVGTIQLLVQSSADVLDAADGWVHCLFSCDLTDTAKRHMYINDVSDLAVITTYNNATLDLATADWGVGGRPGGNNKMNGDVADLWFDDVYIDFSTEANRRKFIDSRKKPVFLGTDGSGPTGTAPSLFLSGATSAWHTNDGSGGGLTLTGTLTTSSSSPSD